MLIVGVLDGKVAIVTGSSRGIGAAIATRFAKEGAAVAVTGRTEVQSDERLPGTIHDTVDAITGAGGTAIAVRADLVSAEDREHLVRETERELGPADILVNNAAVTWFIPLTDFPASKYRIMFEVQVRAAVELAQLVLPGMCSRKRGWILNISSGAARHPQGPPFPTRRAGAIYGMCKAALERFSTGLAAEVYEHGVAVNALSPSFMVATPGVLLHGMYPPPAEVDSEPVDVMADAALILCSGDPRMLTGRIAYSQEVLDEFGVLRDSPNRALQTVLFADIASSTRRAAEAGDRRWRELLDLHDALAGRVVRQHQGTIVKSTGDGVLAMFDRPARGVLCARDLVTGAEQLGLGVRAGLHTGEVELRGDDVAGIAVHLAHRVSDLADPGSILVSRTVVDLVFGSELRFTSVGDYDLRDVPGNWTLFRLDRD